MVELESTSSIQLKHKLRRSCLSQSKLPFINPPIVLNNIQTQESLIAPISMMTILDSKIKKSASEPSLMKASDKHENEDINMGKTGLLI